MEITEESSERETNIFDLNDDCLSEIFKYLSYDDLLNVESVDKNGDFKGAIHLALKSTLIEIEIRITSNHTYIYEGLNKFISFLKLFGNNLSKLSLRIHMYSYIKLLFDEIDSGISIDDSTPESIIGQYCNEATLQHLEFHNFRPQKVCLVQNAKLFRSVKELHLSCDTSFLDFEFQLEQILDTFTGLKRLFVQNQNVRIEGPILSKILTTELQVLYLVGEINFHPGKNCSVSNFSVRELGLPRYDHYISKLLEKLPNVEILKILWPYWSIDRIEILLKLPHLRHLDLGWPVCELTKLEPILIEIQKRNKLDTLKLYYCSPYSHDAEMCKRISNHLSKMTNLKRLSMSIDFRCNIGAHLEKMARQLVNLNHVELYCRTESGATFDAELKQILSFVEHAKELKVLKLSFASGAFDLQELFTEIQKARKNQGNKKRLRIAINGFKYPWRNQTAKQPEIAAKWMDRFAEMTVYKGNSHLLI